jgi:hypothetical protein
VTTRAKPYENNTANNVRTRRVHRARVKAGVCVNNAAHGTAFRGGRCIDCWARKLDGELVDPEDGQMRTRARWRGTLPAVGDWLSSPIRPRYAYQITAVNVTKQLGEVTFATFTIERYTLDQVPQDALFHEWKWDRRTRKKGRRRP